MKNTILSICIPVYNRQQELQECLESIERNYVDGVEIVISDNNSTDRTVEVIQSFENRIPITWTTQKKNLGYDRNCINVVSMSSGEYCWILGSDDKVCEGSIKLLIAEISNERSDIIHFGYTQNNVKISPAKNRADTSFKISEQGGKLRHLAELQNLSLAFMFISCFAFKRDKWMNCESILLNSVGTNYVHVFAMHSIFNDQSSILVINKILVEAIVSQNEWSEDVGTFLFIDSSAVITLKNKIITEADHFTALCNIFKTSYSFYLIFKIIVAGGGNHFIASINNLRQMGYSRFGLNFLYFCQVIGLFTIMFRLNKIRRTILNIGSL